MNDIISIKSETQAISKDLRALYDDFKNNKISRDDAETLANIAGKNLRAQAILLIESQTVKNIKYVESVQDGE